MKAGTEHNPSPIIPGFIQEDFDNSALNLEKYHVTYSPQVQINGGGNNYDMYGFVERNPITKFGRIHLDFIPQQDISLQNGYICSLNGAFKGMSFMEAMLNRTPFESVWTRVVNGEYRVEGQLSKGNRYVIDLWGYFD